MSKKFFAGVTALTLIMSGILCGCSEKKSEEPPSINAASASSKNSQGNTGFTYALVSSNDEGDSYFGLERYEGGVIITGYVGNETDIVIPEQIDGKPVVGINDFAFCPLRFIHYGDEYYDFYEDDLGKDFTSEDTAKVQEFIQNHDKYSNIKSIQIPASIVWYGDDPFFFCDSLESVKVYGESNAVIYHIGSLFHYCYSLQKVEGTVRHIGLWGYEIEEMPFEEFWADHEESQE